MVDTQEDAPLTNEVVLKKHHGSPIEFVMFVFFFAKTLSDTVIVNLLERSTCLVILEYDDANCTEPVNPTTEGELQQSTTNLIMARSMIEACIPSLLALFIGPWSDTNGRRPLVLLSLAGYTISAIMWCVLSLVPGLHPVYFLFTTIPVAFTGAYVSFFLALFCYVSDVTEFSKRALRMGLLEGACMGGVMVSSLITPCLLGISKKYGYTLVFAISALLLASTFIYTYFCIEETVNIVESERTSLWRFDHVKETFRTSFASRPNHIRLIVMLIILNLLIFIVLMDGELAVYYMFTQKRFNWNLADYTKFTSFCILVAGGSVVFCTWLFVSILKLKDLPLMFVGTLCMVAKSLIQALATSGLYLYIASCFSVITVLITPLSRSQLSKLIPPDELGKIFAFTSFLEATAPLTASPAYSFVYKATMDTFPNTIFWLSTGLCCVSVVLIGTALVLHKTPSPQDGFSPMLQDEVEDGTNVET